jgi:hypothetical protein
MTDNTLNTINNEEQNTLGRMQASFNNAIGKSNVSQTNMITSYLSANTSRRSCYDECSKGWSKDTNKWTSKIKKDASDTSATPAEGLIDVINSCKAGCDLKWPGIVQNSLGELGVDAGKTVGKYTSAIGKEHEIIQCSDLAQFAPKVKLGGLCDANNECGSDVCVNWGGKCALSGEMISGTSGRCGLGMSRIDGSNYAWGTTFNSMCKKDVEKYGLTKWPSRTQYFKYQGVWVKLNSGWGFPRAPDIIDQRLQDGTYIQDIPTALKAVEAYGDYCKGFYQQEGTVGFILQSVGGENPKPSWSQFLSEMSTLNTNDIEGFTSDAQNNANLIKNPKTMQAWGNFYGAVGGEKVSAAIFGNPLFPIAKMNSAMENTCPKKWERSVKSATDISCFVQNEDIKKQGNIGWDGGTFGCNLSETKTYDTECKDVPNKKYTCWHVGAVPKDKTGCKTITGKEIPACYASGGRPREIGCPVPAKIIVWIGRPSQKYFATKDDLVSVLQQVSTEFPDVRLADSAEMEDLIAKDRAWCACGWHRTDVFSGATWKTSQSVASLPLALSYPSNPSSSASCGDGKRKMMSCSTTGGPNQGKGGLYVTFYGTEEFADQKLTGLGFTSKIVESHQQIVEKPIPEDCGVSNYSAWSTCSKPCGPGKHTRTRYVETPQKWGGKACPALSETQSCQIKPCPIDCTVSDFTPWSKCDEECGPGDQRRTRTITRKDKYGGKVCPALSETKKCQDKPCPIDCVVSDYSNWGSCSEDCGPGTKTATRTVTTAAQYGGQACPALSKSTSCQDKPCATDCEVSAFSGWSECSKTCGPGTQTSTRTVTTAPRNGGQACPALSQSQSCNNRKCTSVRIRTDPFGGGAAVTSDYECKNRPDGNGQIHNTAHSQAYGTSSDCGASDQCMLQVTKDCGLRTHMQDRCKSARNWNDWGNWVTDVGDAATNHGCTSTIISESFVGGRKEGFSGSITEGYAPLQGDFVEACLDSGTQDGKPVPGVTPVGDFLVENRRTQTEASSRLKSMQQQIKSSINQMQSEDLQVSSLYRSKNTNLLKQLASYETAIHKLLNMGTNFDTLGAQEADILLRKKSVDMSYYLWLALAISILGIVITRIK